MNRRNRKDKDKPPDIATVLRYWINGVGESADTPTNCTSGADRNMDATKRIGSKRSGS